jgi:lysyl-tRNA synthetase class 1
MRPDTRPDSSVWHIFDRGKRVPAYQSAISFSLISNLVSGLGTDDTNLVLEYLERYDPSAADDGLVLQDLCQKAIVYYQDLVLPNRHFRAPTPDERCLLRDLYDRLVHCEAGDEQALQALPFETARAFDVSPRAVFQAFYEVVLGQERGPRFGTFARLLGKDSVLALIRAALDTEAAS